VTGHRHFLHCAAILPLAIACAGSATAPRASGTSVDSTWVTGPVLASVDHTTGLFRLADPSPALMSLASADSLAVAAARWLANPNLIGNLVPALEQEHGSSIHFTTLQPCARPIYSRGPVGDIPAPVPGWARRGLASHWAIPLCTPAGDAELSVGIPDAPRDLLIRDGTLVLRQLGGGGDFDVTGIPTRFPSGLPLTPEDAVAALFHAAHVRVSRVPDAYNQYSGLGWQLPLCASWHLTVEQPVSVRVDSTGAVRQATEIFVRHAPACFSDTVVFFVAAPQQRPSMLVRFPKDTLSGTLSGATDTAAVSLVGPTVFEQVTVLGP
jgi:hypothetical protein